MKRGGSDLRCRRGFWRVWGLVLVGAATLFLTADDLPWVFDIAAHPSDVVADSPVAAVEDGAMDTGRRTETAAAALAADVDTWISFSLSRDGLNLDTRPFSICIFFR